VGSEFSGANTFYHVHVNHGQDAIKMMFANLLKLPILFLAISKEATEDSSEEETIIILESRFYCIRLFAMKVDSEDDHCSVYSFTGGILNQATVGEAKNFFLLSGQSTGLEQCQI